MHVSMIGTIGRVLTGLRRYVGAAMAALVGGREAAIVQEPWAGDIGVAVALSALYCAPISCFAGCVSTPRVRFRRWALAKRCSPVSEYRALQSTSASRSGCWTKRCRRTRSCARYSIWRSQERLLRSPSPPAGRHAMKTITDASEWRARTSSLRQPLSRA